MPQQNTLRSYEGQDFFLGIDVHLKSWTVTVRTLGLQIEQFTMPPSAEALAGHMMRKYPGGICHSVYEAGFSGYSAHRQLLHLGIHNIVTNPGDIPTRNKERDKKKDRVDSCKLARELQNDSLAAVYVPSRPQEDLRSLCRLRKKLVDHSTRLKNRIKGHLYYRGIVLPGNDEMSHWSANFITWLEQYCPEGRNPGADSLRISLEELRQQRRRITDTVRLLRRYTRNNATVRLLRSIPGFGFVAAVTFYTEIMDMKRFRTLERLCCHVGLVPGSNDSGEKKRGGEMSSLGNRHLRYILVEAAWVAIRHDPELLHSFSQYCRHMKKNRAIIKIARKLLNKIRAVWLTGKAYQPGSGIA